MKITDAPVVVEQAFAKPIETVWAAITEVDRMRQWFFDNIPDFKPELGFETRFVVSVEDRSYTHMWKIIEVEAPTLIRYNWHYQEHAGDSNVLFILNEKNGTTTLQVSTEILEDFPENVPEFGREQAVAGWTYLIHERLKALLQ